MSVAAELEKEIQARWTKELGGWASRPLGLKVPSSMFRTADRDVTANPNRRKVKEGKVGAPVHTPRCPE